MFSTGWISRSRALYTSELRGIISFHFSSHRSQFYLLKNDERNFVPLHSWPHLQVLVEPGNGLAEGLLLGELEVRVAQVGADGESVSNTAVEVDLPGLAGLAEGLLGLVTELGGENLIDFCEESDAGSKIKEKQIGVGSYQKQQWTEDQ